MSPYSMQDGQRLSLYTAFHFIAISSDEREYLIEVSFHDYHHATIARLLI